MSKNSDFFCGILIQMFVVHVKFHREITLVEGVVKKIDALKMLLRKAFWCSDFVFFGTTSTNVIS